MKALQSEGDLVGQFKAELARASEFCFGMALVTKRGLDLIRSAIDHCLERGGRGRVLFGLDLPTEPAAIEALCEIKAQYKRNFELRRFQSGKRTFHPKFSIFSGKTGGKTAIIGSSNLTEEGLSANYEANVLVDDRRVVRQFLDYFEEHFEGAHAKPVDQFWLDQYKHIWAERKKAEQRQRRLREKARTLGKPPANIPRRLRELLVESRKHPAAGLLQQIPCIGPIRAALLIALLQTPHRFRTKRQLWAYSGLALATWSSAEYRFLDGQLQRSKKLLAVRGLNANHNHDLKNIFKGAATLASVTTGPFQEFYSALLAKGMKPSMARLTLARKIAAITLIVWKKGARFDAEHLKPQAA
jgi:HKD family nuclease